MDPIALATWGLAGVTALLVLFSYRQDRMIRNQSKTADERAKEQMKLLGRQVEALRDSAEASQAMADEMLQARKSANPLRIAIRNQSLALGGIGGDICNDGDRPAVLIRSDLLVGSEVVAGNDWPQSVLAPGNVGEYFFYRFKVAHADMATLRVTGRPQDGVEQSREFLFRIRPDGTPEDLAAPWEPPKPLPGFGPQ
jgi:hypothetical protein